MRDFELWLSGFRASIADYKYYVNFEKVFENVETIKVELNILNSLIGSRDIRNEFEQLVISYPQVLKCIPIIIAKRESEIPATDNDGAFIYDFANMNYSIGQFSLFMEKTGVFDLLSNHLISNLVDYVTGVETGLDSNGRKNRGGHLMEDLVESFLSRDGLIKGTNFFKEMYLSDIERKWGIDLSCISNQGTTEKRFDFVVKTEHYVYGIETNFYTSSGSKLNETARSYKTIALETLNHPVFRFVWFTDGQGWISAKNNLRETFDVLENIYNIKDLEEGVVSKLFK